MSQTKYKPVGGILSAELFLVSKLTSLDDAIEGLGVGVELLDDGSFYQEQVAVENRQVVVHHTLRLCSDRWLAAPWFDKEFLRVAAAEGVVARVVMSTGEELLLGHSKRFGFEQSLRLVSLDFSSGERPNSSPRVQLTLGGCDVSSAFE